MIHYEQALLDPEAVVYKFYGWLWALCGWLAGLTKQSTAGYGLGLHGGLLWLKYSVPRPLLAF